VSRGTTGAPSVLQSKHVDRCWHKAVCEQRGQVVRHRGATLAYLAASSSFEPAGQLIRACMQVESRAAWLHLMHAWWIPDRVLGKSALYIIFRLEGVPEQTVRQYFLHVKKLTFKRAPGYATLFQPRGFGLFLNSCEWLLYYYESKLIISRSCPFLVLTTVLRRPRHADCKNSVKNYQGPTTSWENAIRKYLNFPHTFF
jgi:hypothetical protein